MSHTPIYLVEIDAYNIATLAIETLRYSTGYYRTQSGDTPASTLYEPRVLTPGSFSRTMFGRGNSPLTPQGARPQITFGTISIFARIGDAVDENLSDNATDDSLVLDYAFVGRAIRLYVVEAGDAYSTAVKLLDGTIKSVDLTESQYTFRVNDRLPDLQLSYTSGRLLGTNNGAEGIEGIEGEGGTVKPVLLGTVKNAKPVTLNSTTLIYGVNFMPDGISFAPSSSTAHAQAPTAADGYAMDIARVSASYALSVFVETDTNLGIELSLVSYVADAPTDTGVTLRIESGNQCGRVMVKPLGNSRYGVLYTLGSTSPDSLKFALISVDETASPETITLEATVTVATDNGAYNTLDALGDFCVGRPIADAASPGEGYVVVAYANSTDDLVVTRLDITNSTVSEPTGYPVTIDSADNYQSAAICAVVEADGTNNAILVVGGSSSSAGASNLWQFDATSGALDGSIGTITELYGLRLASALDPAGATEADDLFEIVAIGASAATGNYTVADYLAYDPASPTTPAATDTHNFGADICAARAFKLERNAQGVVIAGVGGGASSDAYAVYNVISNGLRMRVGGGHYLYATSTDNGSFALLVLGDAVTLAGVIAAGFYVGSTGARSAVPAPVASIDAVYDKGLALTEPTLVDYPTLRQLVTATVSTGEFATCVNLGLIKLGASPDGDIAADAASTATASDLYPDEIAYSVLSDPCLFRDSPSTAIRFDHLTHIDYASFNAALDDIFGATGPFPEIGLYIDGEQSILDTANQALNWALMAIAIDNAGTIQCRAFSKVGETTTQSLYTPSEVVEDSLQRVSSTDPGGGVPVWRVKLGYDRNQFVQSSGVLAAAVPEDADATSHGRGFLNNEFRFVEAEDETTRTTYKAARDITIYTPIRDQADAEAMASTILSLYKNIIGVYRMRFPRQEIADTFDLGLIARIEGFRFLASQGAGVTHYCFISALSYDLGNGLIEVEIFDLSPGV